MRVFNTKRLLSFLLLVFICQGAFAQADVDSPYSIFGLGQVKGKSMNARLKGMGSVANAMSGKSMINMENPASYAMIDSLAFLFDAGMYFKTSTFSTSTMSERASNASFDYVAMAFGVTRWWRVALGVQPYSAAGYNMVVKGYDERIGNYANTYKGKGGINQVFLGNAFRLNKHISIGANVNYMFGDSETSTTLSFPDSAYIIPSRRGIDFMASSFMFDYGLMYNTNIGSDLNLSVGLTYDQGVNLRGKQTTFIRSIEAGDDNAVEYTIDTVFYSQNDTARYRMPQGFGVGIALQKENRWMVGADFNWTQWSRFARNGVNESLQDSWRVAVGGEYTPVSTSVSNYFTRVSYRLGGYYEQTYMNVNGHSLNKFAVTFGLSLPLARSLSKLNLGLELGQCGTKADHLIQERYVNFTVGMSVFERWFLKRKYR